VPDFLVDEAFWQAAIRLSIPLVLAALGVLLAERSGVMNIGIEGCMLMGASVGSIVAVKASSAELGMLAAMVAGTGTATVIGLFTILLPANQVVIGISVNLLALGMSGLAVREAFANATVTPQSPPFPTAPIPVLESIPALGDILFRFDVITYTTGLLIPTLAFYLFRTTGGIKLRAVGDASRSAAAVALPILGTRWVALLLSGTLGGLAGGYLSIVALNLFIENSVAGRGYVALALVVFGGWNPFGVTAAALIVGTADALQLRLQTTGALVTIELLTALPYLTVIVLLALRRGRVAPPRELGRPWRPPAAARGARRIRATPRGP
jgi:general nucleoside transport system permease protein